MDNNCCICLQELKNDILKLNCNHLFHCKCINNWTNKKNTCPICRKTITKPNKILNKYELITYIIYIILILLIIFFVIIILYNNNTKIKYLYEHIDVKMGINEIKKYLNEIKQYIIDKGGIEIKFILDYFDEPIKYYKLFFIKLIDIPNILLSMIMKVNNNF